MSVLARLGWQSFFESQRQALARTDLAFARIIEEQRGLFRIAGECNGFAEISGRLRHDARTAADLPSVGDWVGVCMPDAAGRGVIHVRLERRGMISRAAAGQARSEQVLAANVDTIFVVTAFAGDLNLNRLERYLAIAWDSGASPIVIVNKADLCDDPESACESVRTRLAFVDVLVLSATGGTGLDALNRYLEPARTIAVLGSSGVGKSTLVNGLLGRPHRAVTAIRGSDGRGRHTTASRHLFELPSGALLIDTPGLRELEAWDGEVAVAGAFSDIDVLAAGCRFGDCGHQGEPGCAVLEAVETGRLDADRLENYRRLLREAAHEERKHDKSAAARLKRRWKQIHVAQRAMYRDRGRR